MHPIARAISPSQRLSYSHFAPLGEAGAGISHSSFLLTLSSFWGGRPQAASLARGTHPATPPDKKPRCQFAPYFANWQPTESVTPLPLSIRVTRRVGLRGLSLLSPHFSLSKLGSLHIRCLICQRVAAPYPAHTNPVARTLALCDNHCGCVWSFHLTPTRRVASVPLSRQTQRIAQISAFTSCTCALHAFCFPWS